LFYVKLPNILGVEHEAFDRYTFEADDEDRVIEGPEGCSLSSSPPPPLQQSVRHPKACVETQKKFRTEDETLAPGDDHAVASGH